MSEKVQEYLKARGYSLNSQLGEGGNSLVYESESNNQAIAIKILKPVNGEYSFDGKKLNRFKDEIKILTELKNDYKVLPVLDTYNFNKCPSETNIPYFTMPRADTFSEAFNFKNYGELDFDKIQEIVRAVRDVATTLSSLQKRKEKIIHRDIKPANLFKLEEKYVIGDFGLSKHSLLREISDKGERIGPKWYIAPEMLVDNDEKLSLEESLKVDVYSLAKTLWKLLSGKKYPLMGQHNIFYDDFRLRSYIRKYLQFEKDQRSQIDSLDYLIEQATIINPDKRITIHEFKYQLDIWMKPLKDEGMIKINNSVVTEINNKSKDFNTQIRIRNFRKDQTENLIKILLEKIFVFEEELKEKLEQCQVSIGKNPKLYNEFYNGAPLGSGCCISIELSTGDLEDRTIINCWMGYGVQVDFKGKVSMTFASLLKIRVQSDIREDSDEDIIIKEVSKTFSYGVPEQESILNEMVNLLKNNINPTLEQINKSLTMNPSNK